MFLRLEIFVDFAIYFDVLESAVKYDKYFRIDCPVVEIRYMPFEHEFESGKWSHYVFLFVV